MADTPEFASALGALPSGLFIATAGTGAGATGFLASWVQQAGFEPPCLTVAVKAGRPVEEQIRAGGVFCLSVLAAGANDLLGHFARGFEPGQPAFEGIATGASSSGVPYLHSALAWLGCRVLGEVAWSDHVLFCGEIVEGERLDDGEPWVHIRKNGLSY